VSLNSSQFSSSYVLYLFSVNHHVSEFQTVDNINSMSSFKSHMKWCKELCEDRIVLLFCFRF
jgi:hypothetical protein